MINVDKFSPKAAMFNVRRSAAHDSGQPVHIDADPLATTLTGRRCIDHAKARPPAQLTAPAGPNRQNDISAALDDYHPLTRLIVANVT